MGSLQNYNGTVSRGAKKGSSGVEKPIGIYPGQYWDAETGLHYNYFRDYNPQVGRYLEADPIGIESGKNHLFIYTSNNPNMFIDPLGLAKICCRLLNSFVGSWFRQRHCYIAADDGTRYGLYPENRVGIPRTNDPRDSGGDCYDCPANDCNQNTCLKNAHNNYPVGVYITLGPNSNTYAGTLARTCCKGGVPNSVTNTPGINDMPPYGGRNASGYE